MSDAKIHSELLTSLGIALPAAGLVRTKELLLRWSEFNAVFDSVFRTHIGSDTNVWQVRTCTLATPDLCSSSNSGPIRVAEATATLYDGSPRLNDRASADVTPRRTCSCCPPLRSGTPTRRCTSVGLSGCTRHCGRIAAPSCRRRTAAACRPCVTRFGTSRVTPRSSRCSGRCGTRCALGIWVPSHHVGPWFSAHKSQQRRPAGPATRARARHAPESTATVPSTRRPCLART